VAPIYLSTLSDFYGTVEPERNLRSQTTAIEVELNKRGLIEVQKYDAPFLRGITTTLHYRSWSTFVSLFRPRSARVTVYLFNIEEFRSKPPS
jgi:hypothetical protein